MGLDAEQFFENVVSPTLDFMGNIIDARMATPLSKQIVLNTCITESDLKYLKQIGGGPALGLGQMEPATYDDIVWYCEEVKGRAFYNMVSYCIHEQMYLRIPEARCLSFNLRLQVVFVRLQYWRVPAPIPQSPQAQADYWKQNYNTSAGKGRATDYLDSFIDLS